MAVALSRLPRYLILEPESTVRVEMELGRGSCEIDVELENRRPERSFVLLIGKKGGPQLQRMRLTGRARILLDPSSPGIYVLLLTNPQKEPLVLRLRGRALGRSRTRRRRGKGVAARRGATRRAPRRAARTQASRLAATAPRSRRALGSAGRPKE